MCLFGHLFILWRFIYSLKLLAQLKKNQTVFIDIAVGLYIFGALTP